MNAFQSCRNTADAVPLYLPQKLFLKPIARINISLKLPRKTMGKTISNWEAMEKIRNLIKPEEFTVLKVTKTSLEFIRFEAEIDNKDKLQFIVEKLNHKLIKLKEFTELMHLKAAEAKLDFPTRHSWDSFFRESEEMDEMKPGERPDTIHISNLPVKWFVHSHLINSEYIKPSEKIFYRVFEKFGRIRHVDIPICDPYRKNMKPHMTGMQVYSFDEKGFFEGYVQFKDYIGFTKTMDAFRNMKLLRKDSEECVSVNIKVDFDKTKHLSDASIRRREIVRDRLVRRKKEKEKREQMEKEEKEKLELLEREREEAIKSEKEKRRQEREKKRKQKILAKLKINGADEITNKIAKEEKKLLKVQRKLEAIRLVEELFRRIKNKHEKNKSENLRKEDGDNELRKYKSTYESVLKEQRDRLHKAIESRVILKSILSGGPRLRSRSSSKSSESSSEKNSRGPNLEQPPIGYQGLGVPYSYPDWMRYPEATVPNPYAIGGYYPPALRAQPLHGYFPYQTRGRNILSDIPGPSRGPFPRRGRGFRGRAMGRRRSNMYQLAQEEEYIRYFQKFLNDHDDRNRRAYSRSRSRSSSRRRSRSSSYSRRRSRSNSRRRSRSGSRRRQRSNSRRRSRSVSRLARSSSRRRSPGSRRRSPGSRRSRSKSRKSRSESRRSRSKSRRSRSESRRSRSGSRKRSPGSRRRSRCDSRKSRSPEHKRRSKSESKRRSRSRSRRRSRSGSNRKSRSSSRKDPRKASVSRTPPTGRKGSETRNEEDQRTENNAAEGSERNGEKSESRRSNSVDSSKFISPQSMRKMRSRSKSWSMPRESENGERTRAWSLSPVNKKH